jgi:hemoglobin
MKLSTTLIASFALALALCAPLASAQDAAADDFDVAEAEPTPVTEPTTSAPVAEVTPSAAPVADASAGNVPATDRPRLDPAAPNPAPADPSLLPVFREFGQLAGLTALVDDFMTVLLADARTRPFFAEVDQVAVKKHLVEQFCVILGGPCSYTGRDMKTSHAGLGIGRGHFNALVEDLQIAMDKRGVPFRAQNKLLARLAPMHREVQTR